MPIQQILDNANPLESNQFAFKESSQDHKDSIVKYITTEPNQKDLFFSSQFKSLKAIQRNQLVSQRLNRLQSSYKGKKPLVLSKEQEKDLQTKLSSISSRLR